MKLRLVILNQFFYPDHSATSQLMTDLAESLAERGVAVTALASRGRYNGGGGLSPHEEHGAVVIERAWATCFGKGSVVGRLADYLSFYLGAAWRLLTLQRHDVVMALTTPPLIGLLALAVCRLRRMKFVSLVQDVYPDVGVALGTFREGSLAARALDRLNRLVVSRAERVIVLGDCMRDVLTAKGVLAERMDVIHNWADGASVAPLGEEERNAFSEAHNLAGRFVVVFSGNFGKVNDFETPLEAARALRQRRDIVFLFIGDGAKATEIRKFARRHRLTNICMLPYQPREALRYSLAAGDTHLVTLAPGLAGLSVPSKTYGVLAAGRPILFVGDAKSDIARLVAGNGCGAVFATGDAASLARTISEWADDREATRRMGREARVLFEGHFDRHHAVAAYLNSLRRALGDEMTGELIGSQPAGGRAA